VCCLDGEEVGGYTTSELEKELASTVSGWKGRIHSI